MATDEDGGGFRQDLSRGTPVAVLAALLLCCLDAVGVWLSSPAPSGVATWLGVVGYTLPLFLVPALVVAAGLASAAWIVRSARREELLGQAWGFGAALPAAIGALSLFAVSVDALAVALERFQNRQLSALLLALLCVVLGLACALAFVGMVVAIRRAGRRNGRLGQLLAGAFMLLPLAVAGFQLLRPRVSDLAVLGGWRLLPPLAASVVLALVWWRARRIGDVGLRRWNRLAAALLVVSLAAFWVLAASGTRWPLRVDEGRLWSSHLLAGARALTDWDRDGYSAHFAGGDCEPLDAAVHPGADEIPGDGIDNNCLGGDAESTPPLALATTRWVDRPRPVANLVVITIEALRPDATSLFGELETTPNLLDLGARSQVFGRFYASTPNTWPSLIDLWSSRLPSQTEWVGPSLAASVPWLPSILQSEGVETMAVLGDYRSFHESDPLRFQRGFGRYDISAPLGQQGAHFIGFPAAGQIDRAQQMIDDHLATPANGRFLLWLHLFEPHASYDQYPGAPVFGEGERGRYASEVWGVDHELGRLFRFLDERQLMRSTAIVVVGDHGEAFGEHGDRFHASSVYDEQVRTLGVLYIPGLAGQRIEEPVSHHDLAPTLLNLLGIRQGFQSLDGRNLLPRLHGLAALEPADVILEMEGVLAIVDWPYKLILDIRSRSGRLFDLDADPGELRDLFEQAPVVRARLMERIVSYAEGGP